MRTHADDQSFDNGQRQGQLEEECRPLSQFGLDIDPPSKVLNVSANDVHADSASRQIRYLSGSGETRFEDQVENFLLGWVRAGLDESLLNGFRKNFVAGRPRPSSDISMTI